MGFDDVDPYFNDDPIMAEQVERWDLGKDNLLDPRRPRRGRRRRFGLFRRKSGSG